MGYSTQFEIVTTPPLEFNLWPVEFYLHDDSFGTVTTNGKWYSWAKDLTEFSLKYPHILFSVHGEGEDPSDIWNSYFQAGKNQHCKAILTFEEYGPEKMK